MEKTTCKLFVFDTDQTGPTIFYVMSKSLELAIEHVKNYKHDNGQYNDYKEHPEKYRILEYGLNEVVWAENC